MESKKLYKEEYILDTEEMIASDGYEVTREFIEKNNELPTAFIVATDTIATGVLRALYEKNINVPNDISIIGFNDLIASQHTIPPLTTIRVHIEHLANAAVDLIIEKVNNRKYCKKLIIPSELVIRESTSKI